MDRPHLSKVIDGHTHPLPGRRPNPEQLVEDEDPLAPARGCMTGVAVGFVLIATAVLAIRLLADGAAALAGLAALAVTG